MDQPAITTSSLTDRVVGIVTIVAGSAMLPRVLRWAMRWLDRTSENRAKESLREREIQPDMAKLHAAGIERLSAYWEKEISSLRAELSDARQSIEKWRAHSETCENRCIALEGKVAMLEIQRQTDQQEIAELRTENDHLKMRVRELEQELNQHRGGRSGHSRP